MNYEQAEQFILSLSNLPRKGYLKNIEDCKEYIPRVQFFLNLLGNPEKHIPNYIHVTGTSGKGSICAFLQSILSASGKRTGLFVSPHPTTLRERWQIGRTIMTKSEFIALVEEIKPLLDIYAQTSPYSMLSYFDLTVILGLLYFSKKKVDYAVIEVGCGGRYDATNVIPHKKSAIISNIGYDHMELLGKTKEKIAFQKAGIICPQTEVFTLDEDKKVLKVLETECKKYKVPLTQICVQSKSFFKNKKQIFEYQNTLYQLKALGEHQMKNALLCIEVAQSLGIETQFIQKGLKNAKQTLRMERMGGNPLFIFDGAHNEDKMKTTVKTILSLDKKDIHLIIGFSEDKKVEKMVQQLATLKAKTIACTRNTTNPFRKVASPLSLKKLFKKHSSHSKGEIFLDPQKAFEWTRSQAKKNDIILITGSIFLSGQMKTFLPQVDRESKLD